MSYQATKRQGGTLNAYLWWNKQIWKVYILYNSNYTFWKKQFCGDGKTMVARSSGEGWIGETPEIFNNETILCDTVKMDMCFYTFLKVERIYNTKNEP